MKEFKTILAEYKKIDTSLRKAALATVVRVRGSSYRSPGARMLITNDGKWVGSISGGCLEGDALRKARQVMTTGIPMTVTYDTREESNQNLGIGLGCNGVIDVLIQPVAPETTSSPIHEFERLVASTTPITMATIFNGSNVSDTMVMDEQGNVLKHFQDLTLSLLVHPQLLNAFDTKKSGAQAFAHDGETIEVFIELIQPSIRIIIFGAGFDARPVSALAKSLGWDVEVTDECVAHIAPLFFPDADKLSLCQRDFVDRDFHITPYTACILMSHNYEYDRDVLQKLLSTPASYIGILGPRKRFDKMQVEFASKGITLTEQDHHRIHSPIGLDVGAETPDEIAISIIGEIQAKFANREGGFLKNRNAPIHQRDKDSDQVFKHIYIAS